MQFKQKITELSKKDTDINVEPKLKLIGELK